MRRENGQKSRIEVDHKDIVEDRLEDGNESFVVGVGEVCCSSLFVLEGYDKAVGESFVQSFRAVVLSPFEGADSGNLSFQCGEFPLDLSNLRGIGVFLELEAHDMTNFLFRGSLKARFLFFIGRFGG